MNNQIHNPLGNSKDIDFDENNLHALINTTNDLIWSVDVNFKLISSNIAFDTMIRQMSGLEISKGIDILKSAVSDEQASRFKKLYERAFSGETFKVTEHTDLPIVFWSELSFYPIRSGEKIVGTACYSHDITERKFAEDKIKRSKANLKAILENTSDSFLLTDIDGNIITFNNKAKETILLTSVLDMEIGQNILDYITEERKDIFKEILTKVRSGEKHQYEQCFHDFEGRFHCYDFLITPVKENGIIKGLCYNGRDITEQKLDREKIEQNDKRLEAERARYTELFLQAPSCICILKGPKHVYEMANPKYLQLTGKKDIIGKSLAEIFPEVASQGFLAMMDNIYESGESFIANEVLIQIFRDRDDKLTDHYLNFVCQPYKNSEEETEGIFFFANVVTEQVMARKKIEQNEKKLEEERKRFSDLFLQAPSCICILRGPDLIFEMANPLYLQFTGKHDLIGKTAAEAFPEVAQQGFLAVLNNVYTTGVPVSGNEVFIQVDRERNGNLIDYYMDFVYQPYKNSAGEIDGVFFFANIVTEQVQARQKIEKNEKYFRALVDNASDLITLTDKDGMLTYVSPAIKRLIGYTPEEITGKSFFSFQHPEEVAELKQKFSHLLANPDVSVPSTSRLRHCNGNYIWIEGTVKNMLDDINVRGIIGNFRDVTSHKLYEEHLIKANRLYSFISQINQAIVHAVNAQDIFKMACNIAIECGHFKMAWIGIIDEVDKKVRLVEGSNIPDKDQPLFTDDSYDSHGPQAFVMRTGTSFICNDVEKDLTLSAWVSYAAEHELKSCMVLPIKKEGNIIGTYNLYASAKDFFDEQEVCLLEEAAGDISFALSVFEKEKHRRAMEEIVAHSEQQLKHAQSIAHFGSWSLDFLTGIATWSEEACRIYGFDPMDCKHSYETWLSFIHPDDLDYVSELTKRQHNTFTTTDFYHRIVRKDGSIRHIYSQSELSINKDGKLIGINGVAHDVTEIKENEATRSKMTADIVKRNIDLEQFSYIVSHNLRAPVANILGLVDILQTVDIDTKEGNTVTGYLATAALNLDTVIADINSILETKHSLSKKREAIKFADLLNEVKNSIGSVIDDELVQIRTDFSQAAEIVTIKSYLYSIFLNIITNSIKYRRPNILPVITITSSVQKNKIVVVFKDNGLGIDLEKNSQYLFGLYKRFHNHVEGKGMGLYMVKTQLESLGGMIKVSSEVNKGTEFTLEFSGK